MKTYLLLFAVVCAALLFSQCDCRITVDLRDRTTAPTPSPTPTVLLHVP